MFSPELSQPEEQKTSQSENEVVMTKDLSYSYVSLQPKDKREREIYFKYKIKEIGEIYIYYLALIGILLLMEIIQFIQTQTALGFGVLVYTIFGFSLRTAAHLQRESYPRLYNWHIVFFYVLGQLRYAFAAYFAWKETEPDLQQEQSAILYKKAQEQMTAHWFAVLVFVTPNFISGVGLVVGLFGTQTFLVWCMLSPGYDGYVRDVFSPIIWGVGGLIVTYILQHREIKRQITDRRSTLKWQQMVTILDSQSDAIVAIQNSQQRQSDKKESTLAQQPILFSNRKSKELFQCNLVKDANYNPMMDELCFLQLNSLQESLAQKPLNPLFNRSRILLAQARKFSLRQILQNKNADSLPYSTVEVYKMVKPGSDGEESTEKTLIVKRMDFMFDQKECQIINITDISAYIKLEKTQTTNKLLKTLNTSVHHEMLTPLKTIIEISERLVTKLKKFPIEMNMIKTILLSSQFLSMHAHDFLDQQIIEHGSFVPHYDTGRVEKAISEMVQIMNYSIQKRNLSIQYKSYDNRRLPLLKYDKRRLQQVLLNLLSNACKFQSEGEIRVEAHCTHSIEIGSLSSNEVLIEIMVQDQGVGMSTEKLDQVFQAFGHQQSSNGENDNVVARGNGVGLSICKQICEQLGGKIVARSVPGSGSIFTYTMKAFRLGSEQNVETKKKKRFGKLQQIQEESDESSESYKPNLIWMEHGEEAKVGHEQDGMQQLEQPLKIEGCAEANQVELKPDVETISSTLRFQGTIINIDYSEKRPFMVQTDHDGPMYNDLSGLIDFMNEHAEFYSSINASGSIVVVDDQFINQQGIKLNLMDLGLEQRVQIFSNGNEAIGYFDNIFEDLRRKGIPQTQHSTYQPVALLLLDINMPLITGMEVFKVIHDLYRRFDGIGSQSARRGRVKVIRPVICYLSQYERMNMIQFIQEDEKADCYLEKPLPLPEIKSLMRLLRIHSAGKSSLTNVNIP